MYTSKITHLIYCYADDFPAYEHMRTVDIKDRLKSHILETRIFYPMQLKNRIEMEYPKRPDTFFSKPAINRFSHQYWFSKSKK